MRKLLPMLAVAVAFTGFALVVKAAEEKTITGMAQCAKLALKETQKCQNVVVVKEDGKEVKYYMVMEGAAKKRTARPSARPPRVTAPRSRSPATSRKRAASTSSTPRRSRSSRSDPRHPDPEVNGGGRDFLRPPYRAVYPLESIGSEVRRCGSDD